MVKPTHPSTYIQPEWLKIIRNRSAEAESCGSLHQEQLQLAYEQRWFKLFVPAGYGGLEMALPDAIRLEEAFSWADGSMGWTVTLCSGAGWFGGFLAQEFAQEIFADREVCLGGSGAPSGIAVITDDGYQITGRWKYATGSVHTTHFTANCVIKNRNETVLNDDGMPLILPFVFDKNDVTIIEDWNTTGLIATGSHSFEVNRLNVPEYHSFKIAPEHVTATSCIYNYPFLQFAEVTLAANICGMACHFIDLCEEIFALRISRKNFKDYQEKVLIDTLSAAKKSMDEHRYRFYETVEKSWVSMCTNNLVDDTLLEGVSKVSRMLSKNSLKHVSELYPFCGLVAASPSAEINRVWRDLHTASQHSLLAMPY